jgi:hypothetical protein
MGNKALSWVMAARKFGIANADEMFPENDEPPRKRPAKKLVRTQTPKTGNNTRLRDARSREFDESPGPEDADSPIRT